jgi:hypothetical protein
MVEIDDRIIRPQPPLDFLAGHNHALTFKEHPQNLKHLFSEENLMVSIGRLSRSQFASGEVELKGTEPNALWRGVHGNRTQNAENKLYQRDPELSKQSALTRPGKVP